jgi:Tol biopolymer transport system component
MVTRLIGRARRARRSRWLPLAMALACKPLVPEVWSADAGATNATSPIASPQPSPVPAPTDDAGAGLSDDGTTATLDAERQIAAEYPIAFISSRSGPTFVLFQLHLASADGKAIRRVTTVAHVAQPVWAPDGRSIAFVWVDVFAEDERLGKGLYLVTPSGSETLTLIEQRRDHDLRDPSWTPDGNRIAYAVEEPDQPRRVWTISRYGGQPQPLLTTGGLTRLSDLRWSPDGARLAFSASPEADAGEDGNREIYVIDVSTGELQRPTDNTAVDRFPAWAADGASLLIASDRERQPGDTERDLFWMPLDGSAEPRLIVTNGTNAWQDVYWPPAAAREP